MIVHIVATAIVLLGSAFSSIAIGAEKDFPKSRVLLEQRVQELKEESRQKTSFRQELTKLEEDIKRAQQCVEAKAPPDQATITAAIAALDARWKALLQAKPETVLDTGSKLYDDLVSAANSMDRQVPTLSDCLSALPLRQATLRSADTPRASAALSDFVARATSNSLRQQRTVSIPRLQSFIFEFQNEKWTRQKLEREKEEQISQEISGLKNVGEVYRQGVQTVRSALGQLLSATQTEIRAAQARIDEIDKSLSEIDDRLGSNAASLDKQLIFAVYMMIGSLLILFLGVRILPTAVADKVIENRSLVEVVSMAFLLLTIIILGTGEKMPREAIGTLLGSIAGYIFGRKMTEKA